MKRSSLLIISLLAAHSLLALAHDEPASSTADSQEGLEEIQCVTERLEKRNAEIQARLDSPLPEASRDEKAAADASRDEKAELASAAAELESAAAELERAEAELESAEKEEVEPAEDAKRAYEPLSLDRLKKVFPPKGSKAEPAKAEVEELVLTALAFIDGAFDPVDGDVTFDEVFPPVRALAKKLKSLLTANAATMKRVKALGKGADRMLAGQLLATLATFTDAYLPAGVRETDERVCQVALDRGVFAIEAARTLTDDAQVDDAQVIAQLKDGLESLDSALAGQVSRTSVNDIGSTMAYHFQRGVLLDALANRGHDVQNTREAAAAELSMAKNLRWRALFTNTLALAQALGPVRASNPYHLELPVKGQRSVEALVAKRLKIGRYLVASVNAQFEHAEACRDLKVMKRSIAELVKIRDLVFNIGHKPTRKLLMADADAGEVMRPDLKALHQRVLRTALRRVVFVF